MTMLSLRREGIRTARVGDLSWISPLATLSLPGGGTTLTDGASKLRDNMPSLARSLSAGHLLVSAPGRGFLAWTGRSPQRWSLDLLAAWPRGRGTGSALLSRFLEVADEAGVSVDLVCLPSLTRFYAAAGFRPSIRHDDRRLRVVRKGDVVMLTRGAHR